MVSARASSFLPGMRGDGDARERGVFPSQRIRGLIQEHRVSARDEIDEAQIQPASLDLRLGARAIQVRASFLPGRRGRVSEVASHLKVQELDLHEPQVLVKGSVYIVPLLESVNMVAGLIGKANPKSTTGRLDVFARLITDGAEEFDTIRRGYEGELFVEVAPKTFNIRVRRGTRLNQVRFSTRVPAYADASRKAARAGEALLFNKSGDPLPVSVLRGVRLSVDLEPGKKAGWRARQHTPVVNIDEIGTYDAHDFWEDVYPDRNGEIILSPGEFYILGSKERVRVPASFAAEMTPYDPSMGEYRVHYAGFFDPGFGYGAGELAGTRAILEVRSHDVPYALKDGQDIARLKYEKLSEPPEKLYGLGVGSSYQDQKEGLSKQFRSTFG